MYNPIMPPEELKHVGLVVKIEYTKLMIMMMFLGSLLINLGPQLVLQLSMPMMGFDDDNDWIADDSCRMAACE